MVFSLLCTFQNSGKILIIPADQERLFRRLSRPGNLFPALLSLQILCECPACCFDPFSLFCLASSPQTVLTVCPGKAPSPLPADNVTLPDHSFMGEKGCKFRTKNSTKCCSSHCNLTNSHMYKKDRRGTGFTVRLGIPFHK